MKIDKKNRNWIIACGCAVVLALCAWGYRMFLGKAFRVESTAYLLVDDDDTRDSVCVKMKELSCRPAARTGFSVLSALGGYTVRSGRYSVEPADNILNLYRKLRQGRQEPVRLTIPSVRTADRLAGFLGRKLMMDSTTVAQLLADSAFCRKYGYDTATVVCLFIPNTYEVYWNISTDDFMKRMQKENAAFWTDGRLAKAEAAGLTPNEVVTLASIVDEETANNGEKPIVAGMYINRLHKEMPLQADPTVKFALGDFSLRRILHAHLEVESPYNTYLNLGLPPGPIRIASVAGIDAVLNYARHDYLYMCAKEDFSGTHNFASTYKQHLANAARYSAALDKRGIK